MSENDEMFKADVKIVMAQTRATEQQAIDAVKKHPGDILGALLEICDNSNIKKGICNLYTISFDVDGNVENE